jgi:hypothetical protein
VSAKAIAAGIGIAPRNVEARIGAMKKAGPSSSALPGPKPVNGLAELYYVFDYHTRIWNQMMLNNLTKQNKDNCFVRFYSKGTGEKKCEYGSVQRSVWVNGTCKSETVLWLGKVLNKDEMIFKSRTNGIFRFTPPDLITRLTFEEIESYGLSSHGPQKRPSIGDGLAETYEPLNCQSFGGVYVASELLRQSGLTEIFTSPFAGIKGLGDTVMPLVLYKLTQGGAPISIKDWWDETYVKFLYPHFQLDSPSITKSLKEIGKEIYWDIFFKNYSDFVKKLSSPQGVIIDSTGFPNAINTDFFQIFDHGGDINSEIRLMVVLDKNSGYPLYFKSIPGNLVDKSTLHHIFNEMDAYEIEVTSAIMDAGYYTEENIQFLYDRGIIFITNYINNLKLYNKIINNDIDDIDDIAYNTINKEKFSKIKIINVNEIGTMKLYAYICKDLDEANKQESHILRKFDSGNPDEKEIAEIRAKLRKRGIFILLSSIEMSKNEVFPFYHGRQDMDQIFYLAKNDVLPLRTSNQTTLRGHSMVVFLASIAHVYMRKILERSKNNKLCLSAAFEILARHVIVVYEDKNFHLPSIPSPMARKIYEAFNITLPKRMPIEK